GDGWNFQVMPAGGDTAYAFYWDSKEVKPGGKRDMAYGYGGGIAASPEPEGVVSLALGGSFEPGKLFTVSAQVHDPAVGPALSLELPDGMELVEGKLHQPVPPAVDEQPSIVVWKARVLRTGEFTLRVRSSTGVTHTKIISVSRPE